MLTRLLVLGAPSLFHAFRYTFSPSVQRLYSSYRATKPSPTSRSLVRMASTGGGGGVQNPMNPELYTEKAWENIAKLPGYGDKYGTQFLEATHILRSLLDDGPAGLAQRILFKAGKSCQIKYTYRQVVEVINHLRRGREAN